MEFANTEKSMSNFTDTVSLPKANTIGLPVTNTIALPEANTIGLPETNTIGLPETNTVSLPETKMSDIIDIDFPSNCNYLTNVVILPDTTDPDEFIRNFVFAYKPVKEEFWKVFGSKVTQKITIEKRDHLEITNYILEKCGIPMHKMPDGSEYFPFPVMCRSYHMCFPEKNEDSFNRSIYQYMLHLFLNYEEMEYIINGTDEEYDSVFENLITDIKITMNMHIDTFPTK